MKPKATLQSPEFLQLRSKRAKKAIIELFGKETKQKNVVMGS